MQLTEFCAIFCIIMLAVRGAPYRMRVWKMSDAKMRCAWVFACSMLGCVETRYKTAHRRNLVRLLVNGHLGTAAFAINSMISEVDATTLHTDDE